MRIKQLVGGSYLDTIHEPTAEQMTGVTEMATKLKVSSRNT